MLPQWEVIGKELERAGHTISAHPVAPTLSAAVDARAEPGLLSYAVQYIRRM